MKKHFNSIFISGVLALLPLISFGASTDYYLKIDTIEGESSANTSTTTTAPDRAVTTDTSTNSSTSAAGGTEDINIGVGELQEGSTDALLEIKGIEGDSGDAKKGNVEYSWKVEEGEKAPGVEPDEIDADDDGEEGGANDRLINAGPKSGWPAGGVSVAVGDVNGLTEEAKIELLATIKAWAEVKSEQDLKNFATGILLEDDRPAETLSLNFEEIKFTHKVSGKFLGLFKSSLTANTEVSPDFKVKVKFPWYGFLFSKSVKAAEFEKDINAELMAAGSSDTEVDGDSWSFSTTARVMELVSNVLKTKHDTAKNSVGNIR